MVELVGRVYRDQAAIFRRVSINSTTYRDQNSYVMLTKNGLDTCTCAASAGVRPYRGYSTTLLQKCLVVSFFLLCASAKKICRKISNIGNMNSILDSTWTAAQAMQAYPETVSVFLTLKTDCVGCYLARFCTLNEVANAYHLPPKQLLEKLEESIKIPHKEQHDETN